MTRRLVNLARVRKALATIDEVLRRRPNLGPRVGAFLRGELPAQEDPMTPTKMLAFRLPEDLIARLDAHGRRLEGALPGSTWTRAETVRHLLTVALDAADDGAPVVPTSPPTQRLHGRPRADKGRRKAKPDAAPAGKPPAPSPDRGRRKPPEAPGARRNGGSTDDR